MPLPTAPRPLNNDENASSSPILSAPASESVFNSGEGVLPTAPKVASTAASTSYKSVGKLEAEDLLTADHSTWAHIEPKVHELSEWAQNVLAENNQTEAVSEARANRGEKYQAMIAKLDRMLLQEIASDKTISPTDKSYLIARVINEILGLGPLEPLWRDPSVTEIIVDGPNRVTIERRGKLIQVPGVRFRDQKHLLNLCQQILAPLNRSIDFKNPLEDGRLPDKSRVNVVHPVVGPDGPYLTIRRHRDEVWSLKELVERGSMTPEMAAEIGYLVHSGCTTIVIGGTGTGKMLSHDTILPTPTGFTTMGEVKIGDTLLDENGKPTKVTAKYSLKDPVPYRVIFSDGTEVLADEDHNWLTSTRAARRSESLLAAKEHTRKRQPRLDERELAVLNVKRKSVVDGDTLTKSDVVALFPERKSMIESFFYSNKEIRNARRGVVSRNQHLYCAVTVWNLLHDHCSRPVRDQRHRRVTQNVVTTKQIKETLRTSTGHTNHAVAVLSAPIAYPEASLPLPPYVAGEALAKGDTSHPELLTADGSLYLPSVFRFSSESQRRALLAGFFDTVAKTNGKSAVVKVSHRDRQLIEDFSSVVCSLGYKTSLKLAESPTRNSCFTFTATEQVFEKSDYATALETALRNTKKNKIQQWRYIVDVVPVEDKVEMSCITVDSPNSLYLCTPSYIVTHNTTVLNALSGLIPADERVVTIEDNLELQLHPERMVAALEARPASADGKGAVSIRMLVRNALRMRPDRIVVGEVRDATAFDMLQAMNTGHDGSLATYHANDAEAAIPRLESMVLMAGELDPTGVKALIAGAVDIIVVASRFDEDGSRRISGIYEVPHRVSSEDGVQSLHPVPIWEFIHDYTDENGKVVGHYERKNELSEALVKKHRLNTKRRFTPEEVYELGKLTADD